MLKEDNERLTQTGPSTPGGDMLRRYWQPAGLSEELPLGGAPVPLRLLGEDLVLFRDEQGRPGLLGLHCAHRGADLSYGRLEDGGLRCIYHGWLYDIHGRCLEQPGEPAGSTFHERIRQTAYPCEERHGIILAYMGPGEPPLIPAYEFLTAPPGHVFATKFFQECNYVQGNEGNFDPQHLSFLHRFFKPRDGDFRNDYHARDVAPTIDPVETDFGMHLYAVRKVGEDDHFVKVRSFIMPNAGVVGSRGPDAYVVNWHVPIDDTHHWRWSIQFRRDAPVEEEVIRSERTSEAENYRLKRNRANRYLQDREEMKTQTFIGLGRNFTVHDTWATESQGPVSDRAAEHPGYTDRGVLTLRKIMLEAMKEVQEGRDPVGVVRDPERNSFPDVMARDDIVPRSVNWRYHWKQAAGNKQAAAVGARR